MENVQISQAEWEVMRVVWTMENTTSKEINGVLTKKMDWKPATTKTLIGRLVKKGLLNTQSEGRKYIYSPAISEEETILDTGNEFLDQICNKKVGHTLAQLIDGSLLSQSDIEEIENVLNEKKKSAPKEVACNCLPGQCDCHIDEGGNHS